MDATPELAAAYEAALPDDPRVERKKMFGMPCAFVSRQMFFGTFGASVVARVGPDRVQVLALRPGLRVFVPTEGRPWSDYVQLDAIDDAGVLQALAAEALDWTAKLPPKRKKPKVGRRAKA